MGNQQSLRQQIHTRGSQSVYAGRSSEKDLCLLSIHGRECLYIGTEGGHIYVLDLISFELKDHVIYQDIVMQR